jgi:hypothetical protein
MSKGIEEYKEKFINYIVGSCICYNHGLYDEKDEERFRTMAIAEYDAQLESIGVDDFDYDSPESDAKECMSYWDY